MTYKNKRKEAIERMKMLNLASKVVEDFMIDGKVYQSFRSALMMGKLIGLTDYQKERVHNIEVEYDCLVYHVIHDYTDFGDILTLLYVSNCSEEWEQDRVDVKEGYPIAYVINMDENAFSEFGSVGVQPFNGGLIRTE